MTIKTILTWLLIALKLIDSMKKPIILSSSQKILRESLYQVPLWCKDSLPNHPKYRLPLSNLPTPIQSLSYSMVPPGCKLFIKRDDFTGGLETGGNKIRKLEFLLPEVLSMGCDSVVTIGGEQSNHVRGTAAACRKVFGKDIEIHTILRMDSRRNANEDIGTTGNLLLDRFFGCNIYTCTPGEYGRVGSDFLVKEVCDHLRSKGKNPYPIPVGGSNAIGTWGYIHAADEILLQLQSLSEPVNHIAFACGSGGTATGIAIGIALATASKDIPMPKLHAIGVCDNPDYFYNTMATIAKDMGFLLPNNKDTNHETLKGFFQSHIKLHQGKGLGYAKSTSKELSFFMDFALECGIVLDPVYTGKALYNFLMYVNDNPSEFENGDGSILFWHTGNALGMFSKVDELMKNMQENDNDFFNLQTISPVKRLDIYGKGPIVPN